MGSVADYVARLILDTKSADKAVEKFDDKVKKVETNVGKKVGAAVAGYASLQTLKVVVADAARLQEAMIGVKKTTGLSADSIERMKVAMLEASRSEVALDAEKLAAYGEALGTIGFKGEDDILRAAITMGKLDKATTDLRGADAARSLGKLLTLTGSKNSDFEDLASLIARLGDNVGATEGEIVHMAKFLGGVASGFKLTKEELIALSATFVDVSVSAENATTAMLKTFSQMKSAVFGNTNVMKQMLAVTKLSKTEFDNLWKTDKVALYGKFTRGVVEYAKANNRTVKSVLTDMKLGSDTIIGTTLKMGVNYKNLANAVTHVKDEFTKYGTASSSINMQTKEANASLMSQYTMLNNAIRGLGDAAANSGLIEFLTKAIKGAALLLKGIGDVIDQMKGIDDSSATFRVREELMKKSHDPIQRVVYKYMPKTDNFRKKVVESYEAKTKKAQLGKMISKYQTFNINQKISGGSSQTIANKVVSGIKADTKLQAGH